MGKVKNKNKVSKSKGPYVDSKNKRSKSEKKGENSADSAVKELVESAPTDDEKLTLELVKELGGTEDDLKLVENIDGGKDNIEDVNEEIKSELQTLISSLNFSKFKSDDFIVKDDEPPKVEKTESKSAKEKDSKVQDNEVSSSSSDPLPSAPATTKPEAEEEDADSETEENAESSSSHNFFFLKDKNLKRTHCVVKSGEKWHSSLNEADVASEDEVNKYWLSKLEKYTKAVWEKDVENYKKSSQKGAKKSESQWIQTVLKSGTLNDKFSAYVLLIQDSPVHNISALETLIDFVNLKSRRPCLMAIDNLQQLFLEVLLIPTRKLRNFENNCFPQLSDLAGGNKDTIDRYLITWMFEDRLKKLYVKFLDNLELVGKDNVDKTRIKALSSVLELLAGNPEQEGALLARLVNKLGDPVRGIAAKALYLLSQLLERHPVMKWVVVAEVERLLYRANISARAQYFGICFLSQILLEKFNQDNLAAKLIKIYFSFFSASVKKGEVDTKLMKALLTGVNRAFPYAVLEPEELDKQMETVHKLVHLVSFNISIQALTLLYQVMDSREAVTDRFYSALYKKILDPELTSSSKQVMFLNLLYKAIKADPSVTRIRAFMKRLLQVVSYQPSHLVCGLLFLMSEVTRARPEIVMERAARDAGAEVTDMDEDKFADDSDEEEHFQDADENNETDKVAKSGTSVKTGWTFKTKTSSSHEVKTAYDPTCRNPLYSGADKCDYWELRNLGHHFHPSAALFAQNVQDSEQIKYTGDPLSDFTLPRFLDRFVFRNPKKNPEKNKPTTVFGKRNIYKPAGIKAIAPDSKDFLNRDSANVPNDELFIYKYFQEKLQRKGGKVDDDVASVTSEEFNDFLDNYGGRSKDFDDEDMDFAGGLGDEKGESDTEMAEDEDESTELPMNDSESDDESPKLDGEDEGNFKDLSSGDEDGEDQLGSNGEFDEEAFGGDSLDEGDDLDEEGFDGGSDKEDAGIKFKKQKKMKKMKFAKFDPNDLSSILADAEEFSHLIEENDDAGTSSSMANKDKAGKKQLSWEKNNDSFMKGQSWKKKKNKSNKPSFGAGSKKTHKKVKKA